MDLGNLLPMLKNIEIGPVKITGGSALVVLGLAVLAGGLDWLSQLFESEPLSDFLNYGAAIVLIVAGILWFFFIRESGGKTEKK